MVSGLSLSCYMVSEFVLQMALKSFCTFGQFEREELGYECYHVNVISEYCKTLYFRESKFLQMASFKKV